MRKEVNFRFKIWALLLITVSNEGLHLLATSFPLLQSEAVDLRVLWLFVVVVVQSLSHVRLFGTQWTVAHQASLSFTISQNLLEFMSNYLLVTPHFAPRILL